VAQEFEQLRDTDHGRAARAVTHLEAAWFAVLSGLAAKVLVVAEPEVCNGQIENGRRLSFVRGPAGSPAPSPKAGAGERSQYLLSAWRAAGHEQRAEVLREDAPRSLEVAWLACTAPQRRAFVAIRAREVAAALDEALLLPPPDWSPLQRESKQSLARRLNAVEQRCPTISARVAHLRSRTVTRWYRSSIVSPGGSGTWC
jgi:hypothetical protein